MSFGKYQPSFEIRSNHRYETLEGSLNGEKVFLKRPVNDKLRRKLPLEARGLAAMKALDPDETLFEVPSVLELTEDYIATEWVEGRPMKEDFTRNDAERITGDLAYLKKLYLYVDQHTIGTGAAMHFDSEATLKLLADLREQGANQHIDDALLEAVAQYIVHLWSRIETRPAHGDLQPGNIMVADGRTPAVIDCESFADSWPRHYSVVNFVFNYSAEYPALAPKLQELFFEYCHELGLDLSRDVEAFNISAATRCLQMVKERLGGDGLAVDVREYIEGTMENITRGRLFFE